MRLWDQRYGPRLGPRVGCRRVDAHAFRPWRSLPAKTDLRERGAFGQSLAPIREALLQLVAQDILMGQRGFSVRVPIPSVEQLAEVRAIRTKLEIMAATNAMHEWTPEGIAELERIHAELQLAKAAGDVTRILRANVRFHFALYGAERRSYLMTMIRTQWAITGPSTRAKQGRRIQLED